MEINQLQTHIRHYGVLLVMSIHSWGCRSARYTALWTHIACSETVRDLLSSAFGLLLVVLLLLILEYSHLGEVSYEASQAHRVAQTAKARTGRQDGN